MASLDTPWRPRMVIFDNNGTALDDLESVAYPSVRHIFESYGLQPPSLEVYRQEITGDFMQFYRRHGFDALPEVTKEDLNNIRREFYDAHRYEAIYRRGFLPLLHELTRHGIIIGMCSAEIPMVLEQFLELNNLYDCFSPSRIVGGAWPSKAPYLARMVADEDLHPSQATYIDDTVDGLESAKAAGLQVIGFTSGYESPKRLRAVASDTVASFEELSRRL